MKTEDREALHRTLDAVIDKIESAPERAYVAFEVTSFSYMIRASESPGDGWLLYEDFYGSNHFRAELSEKAIADLAEVRFSDTKQETSTTVEE